MRGKARDAEDGFDAYPQEKWDEMRPLITSLHEQVNPKLTYPKLLAELGARGFRPSPSALKRRLKEWKLYRSKTESNMIQALDAMADVQVRRQPIDADDASRFLIARGYDQAEILALRRDSSSDSEVILTPSSGSDSRGSSGPNATTTPSGSEESAPGSSEGESSASETRSRATASSLASNLDALYLHTVNAEYATLTHTPVPLYTDRAAENLLRCIPEYFRKRLAGEWELDTPGHSMTVPSMSFGGLFLKFHNERQMHDYQASHDTRATIFRKTRGLVARQDPRLLLYFLEALAFSRANGYEQLALEVNCEFARQALHLYGPTHELSVFCGALLHAGAATRNAMVEMALVCMLQQYLDVLAPPYSLETTRVLLTGAMVLKHLGFYATAIGFLRRLFPLYEHYYTRQSGQVVQCLVDETHIHIALGDLQRAEQLLGEAKRLEGGIGDPVALAESKMRVLIGHAVIFGLRRQREEELRALQTAQAFGRAYRLPEDHWAVRDARAREVEALTREMGDLTVS